jgi:NFACT protein C-terminal domain
VQANPFNQGLDEDAVASAIAKAKQPLELAPDAAPADAGDADVEADSDSEGSSAEEAAPPPALSTAAAAANGEAADTNVAAAAPAPAGAAQPAATTALPAAGTTLRADLSELPSLTGQPKVEDTLLYAVPMLAPYDSLGKFKFRVKVTPGGQKKGKAGRQAVELLCRGAACTARCAPHFLLHGLLAMMQLLARSAAFTARCAPVALLPVRCALGTRAALAQCGVHHEVRTSCAAAWLLCAWSGLAGSHEV